MCIRDRLFVEQETSSSIRASAQGLFFMMTNGLGAIIGGYARGAVVDLSLIHILTPLCFPVKPSGCLGGLQHKLLAFQLDDTILTSFQMLSLIHI